MIRGLVPTERLLEWTVEDGWEPLCEFLGKPVPDEPFPHVNAAAGWAGQEMKIGQRYIVEAAINVGIFCVIAAGAWAIYSRYW
jgi:hypothetical protein